MNEAWIRMAMQVMIIRVLKTGVGTLYWLFYQASGNILGSFIAVMVKIRLLM